MRLRFGRVPVHGVAVRAAQVPPALVRRGAEGRTLVAVLVGRCVCHRDAVTDVPDQHHTAEQTGARQEVGIHVAGESVRAIRLHDVHDGCDGRRVPAAHDVAIGRGPGRRVSAPAARPPRPRLATV